MQSKHVNTFENTNHGQRNNFNQAQASNSHQQDIHSGYSQLPNIQNNMVMVDGTIADNGFVKEEAVNEGEITDPVQDANNNEAYENLFYKDFELGRFRCRLCEKNDDKQRTYARTHDGSTLPRTK